jgi:hypothetical protein
MIYGVKRESHPAAAPVAIGSQVGAAPTRRSGGSVRMGIGDMADKAKDMLGANKDKVDDAIETAGDKVDEKTGGKYAKHVDKGQDMAREQAETHGRQQQ